MPWPMRIGPEPSTMTTGLPLRGKVRASQRVSALA